jgi:hypothetical protein
MRTYKWTVTFEAENEQEASDQVNEAMMDFASILDDNLLELDEED